LEKRRLADERRKLIESEAGEQAEREPIKAVKRTKKDKKPVKVE